MILSTLCSIIQQVHTISEWRTIVREMFLHAKADPHNAELKISGGSVGMDRSLYYIRMSTALSHFPQ